MTFKLFERLYKNIFSKSEKHNSAKTISKTATSAVIFISQAKIWLVETADTGAL